MVHVAFVGQFGGAIRRIEERSRSAQVSQRFVTARPLSRDEFGEDALLALRIEDARSPEACFSRKISDCYQRSNT